MGLLRGPDSTRGRQIARAAVSNEDLASRAADTSRAAMLRRLDLALIAGDTAVAALSLRQVTARRSPSAREDVWLRGMLAASRRETAEAARADSALARSAAKYDFGWTPYHRARIAAAVGDADRAVRLLSEARESGYPFSNTEGFRPDIDPFFVGLHGHARFESLVAAGAGRP